MEEKNDLDFVKTSGKLQQVDCGGKSFFVGVNNAGKLLQKGAAEDDWKQLSGSNGSHISVGDDGNVWYCQKDGDIYSKGWDDESWKKMSGKCTQIDCGDKDSVACVNKKEEVSIWQRGRWVKLPVKADQVSIGSDGELWGIQNKKIYRYDYRRRKWQQKPGRGKQISVADAGSILLLKNSNDFFYWNGRGWDKCTENVRSIGTISAASDGTIALTQTDNDVYMHSETSWEELPGSMKQIATGGNQTVVAVNRTNDIFVLTETRQWKKFPGKAMYVDVGDDGEFWGVTPQHKVVRWSGGEWESKPGKAKAVYVGSKDCVVILQGDGDLFEWDSGHWKKLGTNYSDASAGCDGEIWAVERKTNDIVRRSDDDSRWRKYPGKATHISCGDEDSVIRIDKHRAAYRKEWSGHRRGANREWWEKWSGDGEKFGDSLNIGPDGTCVRLGDGGKPYVLWGEDDPDSSDSEADEDAPNLDDAESLGTIRVTVKVPNYQARRRQCVRRAERSRRRTERAVDDTMDEIDEEIDESIEEYNKAQRQTQREIERTEREIEREIEKTEKAVKKQVSDAEKEAKKAARKAKRAKRKLQRELRKERSISLTVGLSF